MTFMAEAREGWAAYAGFLLNGVGTVLVGPLLPRLESQWGLGDGAGGALLAAGFLGSSLGTVLVLRGRRRALTAGGCCAWLGLSAVAALLRFGGRGAGVETLAIAALLVYGFGLGQAITALNLGAGARSEGRSSRLSFGNAMWSVGAILAPMVVSVALAGHWLWVWVAGLALVFPVVWMGTMRAEAEDDAPGRLASAQERATAARVVVVFAALMFLYGSAESCLSGWVTTFARRAGGAGMVVSPLSTSAFWFGVAGGRAIAAVALRRWREREALLLLAGGSAAACLGLLFGDSMGTISAWAAMAGLMLGPAFAVVLAGLLNQHASDRQAGMALAMCGLGATLMPLLLGVVSEQTASLRAALVLPGICLVGFVAVVTAWVQPRIRAAAGLG
jgi:fucose permease